MQTLAKRGGENIFLSDTIGFNTRSITKDEGWGRYEELIFISTQ